MINYLSPNTPNNFTSQTVRSVNASVNNNGDPSKLMDARRISGGAKKPSAKKPPAKKTVPKKTAPKKK